MHGAKRLGDVEAISILPNHLIMSRGRHASVQHLGENCRKMFFTVGELLSTLGKCCYAYKNLLYDMKLLDL